MALRIDHCARRLRFQGHDCRSNLAEIGTTDKTGTRVTFLPDPSIFPKTEFEFDVLSQRLRELSFLNAGLRIEYENGVTERFNRQLTTFDPTAQLLITQAAERAYANMPLPERSAADFKVLGGSRYAGQDGADRLEDVADPLRVGGLVAEREGGVHRQSGAQAGRPASIWAKLNSLVDPEIIDALYRASQAGVAIDLVVRGICCLRPGVPGVSETITVRSVVGRFLEHARVYYFRNGGQHEVLLGSADLMPRNLDARVEVLFPVLHPQWRDIIMNEILAVGLQYNVQARELLQDGSYRRVQPRDGAPLMNSQEWLLTRWRSESKKDALLRN